METHRMIRSVFLGTSRTSFGFALAFLVGMLVAGLAESTASAGGETSRAAPRPHIVHIVADDLGWKDVGFNGCADIKTPNIDRLAAEGAVLSQFYTQSMCTPTRAAMLTGRYPYRYGLQTAVIPSVSAYGLDTEEWLMPQVLKDAGYTTAIIGKWHLGHADKKWWPRQRGFDYQYGAMIGELDYFTHQEHGVRDWFRDNEPVAEEGYTTTLIGKDAARLIENHDPSVPLYLYLTFNAPHTPYQAPQEYIDRFPDIAEPTRRIYAGMISCLDDEIGRVVRALERAGMRERTIIIFHSDNGGTRNALFSGVMTDMSKIVLPCDNGPYREGKGTLFEGGSRVCAFVNWPGMIETGRVDGMIHAVDLFPTLAALAGAPTTRSKPLDGLNVWETLSRNAPSPRDEIIYNIEPFRAAIRQGNWKLIWRTTLPQSVDLYNLAEDPSETNNIASKYPDIVGRMKARIDELSHDAAKPLFLIDQFKVIQTNMKGEPVLPIDDEFGTGNAH